MRNPSPTQVWKRFVLVFMILNWLCSFSFYFIHCIALVVFVFVLLFLAPKIKQKPNGMHESLASEIAYIYIYTWIHTPKESVCVCIQMCACVYFRLAFVFNALQCASVTSPQMLALSLEWTARRVHSPSSELQNKTLAIETCELSIEWTARCDHSPSSELQNKTLAIETCELSIEWTARQIKI